MWGPQGSRGREYTRKMAARWGAGEETLTACNMEFFPMDTLDETKGLDEESEATLLTALTEILDNVDDENLSPFDTLPDSDLLSGQKGREHSPLRRLMCLSRSPPEKDSLCTARPTSTGKSLPRVLADSLQRSDGEEEDDGSLTLSPVRHNSSLDNDLLDWEGPGLPLSVTFEQEGEDGVSVSLGDLVRHMHPYCMAICVENDDGEQMLPEGGILLEVVDQGENGEPILAIPNMDLPVSLPLEEQSSDKEQKPADVAEESASDSSEHIIVDVDDEDVNVSDAPVTVMTPATPHLPPDVKDEMITKQQKEDVKDKSTFSRKKKKKYKEEFQHEPVGERVLRSGTVRNTVQEAPIKPEKRSVKEKKSPKVPKVPVASTPASSSVQPQKLNPCQTETQITTTTLLPNINVQVATCASPRQDTSQGSPLTQQCSSLPTAVSSQQPDEAPKQPDPAPAKLEDSSAAPCAAPAPLSSESPAAAQSPVTPPKTPPVCEALPPMAAAVPEPKPKSLSLAEYRRLRQQKKPMPVEKQDDNSTKWPSLPELPKELPPIPCLPDPSPKDSRRPSPRQRRRRWRRSSLPGSQGDRLHHPPLRHCWCHRPTWWPHQSSGSPASLKHTTADGKCSPALSGGKDGVDAKSPPQPVSLKSVELINPVPKTTTESIKPSAATVFAPSAPQKTTVVFQKVPQVTAAATLNSPITADNKASKPTPSGTQQCPHPAAQPSDSQSLTAQPVVLETKANSTTTAKAQKAKSPTQELIESFTSEIGIEAADLTSLLEQFEETQAKEEHCVPEVSGRAVAVGNSSFELAPEKTVVDRVRANDLSSTAALTPPTTPPHQMWKPLAPVALLGKSKATEASKSSPSKVIQIEARPLPSVKSRSKPTPAAAPVDPELACMDHDYCLPNKGAYTGEPGKRWNVKQQSYITIKPIKQVATTTTQAPPDVLSATNPAVKTKTQDFPTKEPLDHRTDTMQRSSVLETPDASPDASPAREETDSTGVKEESHRRGPFARAYRQRAASRTPSPRSSPKERTGGRSRKRGYRRSPSPMSSSSEPDSHSSRSRSRSCSPSKKRYRSRHSESSSSSSSRSSSRSSPSVSCSPPRRRRYSYSSSRSGSWSRSRSRSQSPRRQAGWSRSSSMYSPSYRPGYGHSTKPNVQEVKRRKEKAIEERRVVYVGRIRGTMTQKELRERFSYFGEIEECTLHFRDHGDNYGFVTYYSTKDAFTAIENGGKLRKPDELPFDLCFGGRRQFCQMGYSDLDSSREYDPLPVKGKFQALDFDTLLKQAQQNLKR
ncbi:hypothetical protein INR49_001072 [Caranx melampygus]|nr:hypothetical protein INR49_001072 [Caranx melampygus]